jgi:hypothetical protein
VAHGVVAQLSKHAIGELGGAARFAPIAGADDRKIVPTRALAGIGSLGN